MEEIEKYKDIVKKWDHDSVYLWPINSGLGDRIGNIIVHSAFAKINKKKCYTSWNKNKNHRIPTEVNEFIQFPENVIMLPDKKDAEKLKDSAGLNEIKHLIGKSTSHKYGLKIQLDVAYGLLMKVQTDISHDKWKKAVLETAKQIHPKFPLKHRGVNYICLHMRYGDKKKSIHTHKGADKTVNANLHRIINNTIEKTNMPFIVCSDHHIEKDRIEKYIISKNGKVLDSKPVGNTPPMIYEFFLMSDSKGIIQYIADSSEDDYYGGWSSFSNVAAYIKDIPIIGCVSSDRKNRYTYYQEYFDKIMKVYKDVKENKTRLHNIYYQDEADEFISKVIK